MENFVDYRHNVPAHGWKKPKQVALSSRKRIVVHTADGCPFPVDRLIKYDLGPNHISKHGLATPTYNIYVTKDGMAHFLVPFDLKTAHAGIWNRSSVSISCEDRATGNAHTPPPKAVLKTLIDQCAHVCLHFGWVPNKRTGFWTQAHHVAFHRELPGTGWIDRNSDGMMQPRELRKTCPGMKFDAGAFRFAVIKRFQSLLTGFGIETDVDGIVGPQTMGNLNEFIDRHGLYSIPEYT